MKTLVSMVCGVLFGVGLWLSGMTDPANVIGFLDVTGTWNPALAFVMGGAIGVFAPSYWFFRGRTRPVFDTAFHPPAQGMKLDARLILGSTLFGVGWGLAGICPGPGVVNAASGDTTFLVFALAMAVALVGARSLGRKASPAALPNTWESHPI